MLKNLELTIANFINKQSVAFISSVDNDGFPNLKAMLAPRKCEGIKIFHFTTNVSSKRVAQYRTNSRASIYFYDKRFVRGVMLKGTMEVLEDAASKKMVWEDDDTMYYPQGIADPDYCVLKFTAQTGRYYANLNSEDFNIE